MIAAKYGVSALSYVLALLMIVLIAKPAYSETIVIASDIWCPYVCEEGSDKPGILIEIAKKAFSKHNINVDYKILPWTRAITDTRSGIYNAIAGAAKDDAPDFIFPMSPQITGKTSFFTRKGHEWRYTDLNSLNSITLGVVTNYAYEAELDAYIRKNRRDLTKIQQVEGANALELNIKKLLKGRIDAFVEEEIVAAYQISSSGLDAKIILAGGLPVSRDDELFITFAPEHKDSKRYSEILDQEMSVMKKTGDLDAIMNHYTQKNIKPESVEN